MIFRVLNFVVIGVLILAAAWVYQIKFDAAVQAERLAKLRGEVIRERDQIAAFRAEWGQLDNPARIEVLAKRYLRLNPIAPTQFDTLDRLPDRAPQDVTAGADPVAGVIGNSAASDAAGTTGNIRTAAPSGTGGGAEPAASGAPRP